MTRVLAGDIGGTKTELALYRWTEGSLASERFERTPSRDHTSFTALLEAFLAAGADPLCDAACLAVAGPVFGGASALTNLPWHLDEASLAATLGGAPLRIVNDLAAMARGMLHLPPSAFAVINPGAAAPANASIAVLAAGTGLGEALLHWDGADWHALASEGGHADFAAQSELEIALLRFLRQRHGGHVSWERVLSGTGLVNLYDFLRRQSGTPEPPWLTQGLAGGDPAPVIAGAGLDGRDGVAAETLTLFARLYGAEAANLALKGLALGGVYLGGGIAPNLLPALQGGAFMRGFTAKGRFADLLSEIRVSVCLEPRATLIGAAHNALRLAGVPSVPAAGPRYSQPEPAAI
jgi:glucokinase